MRYAKTIYIILFTIVLYLSFYKSGYLEYFDYKLYDLSSKIVHKSPKRSHSSVVVVDIDEKSLKYLGQWPWSRLILSKLLENIASAHPANIGMDIIFPESDKTSLKEIRSFFSTYLSSKINISGVSNELFDNDKIFAKISEQNRVTLPVYMTDEKHSECYIPKNNREDFGNISSNRNSKQMLCNLDILQRSASNIGFINAREDDDGILRRVSMFIKYKSYFIPAFALANLMNIDRLHVSGNKISILNHTFKMDQNSNVLLNFYNEKWYQSISAVDILSGNFDKSKLAGKFILIGTSAIGLHDRYLIPKSKIIPGVFAHATLIDNIMDNLSIFQPQFLKYLNILLSFLFSLSLLFLLYKRLYLKVLGLFLAASTISFLVNLYFLNQHIYISIGYFLAPYIAFFFIINIIFIIFYYKERQIFLHELATAHSETIDSMSLIVETRDAETGAHILRTKEYMKRLMLYLIEHDLYKKHLTKDKIELIYSATALHDIGKVGIPDYVLKKPGKLTKDEYVIMQQHPEIGKNIIQNAMKNNKNNNFLKLAYNIAYYHHEKWDGSGYPCKLEKDNIPLEARMMALVDVYDALISRRCYKLAFDYSEAEDVIIQGSGKHFDPILVGVFIELKDEFREIAKKIR